MMHLIVCSDISICLDPEGGLHGGVGLAFYREEIAVGALIHELSEHRRVVKGDSHELEWRAIGRAMKVLARQPMEQAASVAIYSDSDQAQRRWQDALGRPPEQQPRVLKVLAAYAITIEFRLGTHEEIRRAHDLARYAALSKLTTPQGLKAHRQLAERLKR